MSWFGLDAPWRGLFGARSRDRELDLVEEAMRCGRAVKYPPLGLEIGPAQPLMPSNYRRARASEYSPRDHPGPTNLEDHMSKHIIINPEALHNALIDLGTIPDDCIDAMLTTVKDVGVEVDEEHIGARVVAHGDDVALLGPQLAAHGLARGGRDLYADWCQALRERFHDNNPASGMSLMIGQAPPAPKDYAFLTYVEQHAWDLLADAVNHGDSMDTAIARSRIVAKQVSDATDDALRDRLGHTPDERPWLGEADDEGRS